MIGYYGTKSKGSEMMETKGGIRRNECNQAEVGEIIRNEED